MYAVTTGEAVQLNAGTFVVTVPVGLRSTAGTVYTTVTDFEVTLPAVSRAVTVTVLAPRSSATSALHDVVPIALPLLAPFVQVTLATPPVSDALPTNLADGVLL
jgi:hypothetical protein